VLYISAEESAAQIRMRADRLGASTESDLYILSETGIEEILEGIRQVSPKVVIVDSIQTVYANESVSAPGTVSQVRNCASLLMRMAKSSNIAVFLVGHVTKEGSIAGPKVLEHMVDTVLYFEGERNHAYRILRAVKNRFGSTNEVGIFEMCEDGMCAVEDVSGLLLTTREDDVPGTGVLCSVEGSRPMLVEIQALISTTCFGNPRRMSTGFDYNRMVMVLAVLEKRLGLSLGNQDAYVNVAGGLRLDEPAADLAVACAISSSATNRPIRPKTVMIGEIGLTGEVRPVNRMEVRLAECVKGGFERIIIPAGNKVAAKYRDMVIPVKTVADAFNAALG
jgi:DNA repair protein RadA/Sms